MNLFLNMIIGLTYGYLFIAMIVFFMTLFDIGLKIRITEKGTEEEVEMNSIDKIFICLSMSLGWIYFITKIEGERYD